MVTIRSIIEYRRSILLIALTVILAILLCKSLIGRPLRLIKENRTLQAELAGSTPQVQQGGSTSEQDSLNMDVILMKAVTDGGCVLVQGEQGQIAKVEGAELIQYEVAYSGTYAGIMTVWKGMSSILPDAAHITCCRIAPERDKDRKGWSLVCRTSIQTIRAI